MSGQVLDVFQWDALTQQICYCRNTKRMWAESQRQAAGFHATFDHAADVTSGHGPDTECFRFANGCAEQGMIGGIAQVAADRLQIGSQQTL